ncbi:hypothetical protein V5O48_012245 [Marasmius crinis-equi]|uniref:Methyltransferase-domain-containing protein n=1 Tax=Marasmius crinis-equi TaxID=585013 RepID=A0ABR3F3C9_9AGAR
MFFYLSFLRPPPLQSPPSSQIKITPQIANDLRTEPFEGSQDIYFSWSPATTATPTQNTKPAKLTTWRQENAYKEIMVPLPPNVREGQRWRLILSSTPDTRNLGIDLRAKSSLGRHPFSVMSMPILFTKFAGKNTGSGKQEQVERVYRFSRPAEGEGEGEEGEVAMKITEQTSFDLDKVRFGKIWDSGIGLSSWLTHLASSKEEARDEHSLSDRLRQIMFSSTPRKIVELGAGTGIVSLVLSALRSGFIACSPDSEQEGNSIMTTDLPSAMPLLEHNVSQNSHLFPNPRLTPQAKVLDWDQDLPEDVTTISVSGNLDIIVMADVTYNTSSFPALIRTLSRLMSLNAEDRPPFILLGYKERDAAERSLWDMAREIGIQFTQVDQVPGAGGVPIEIWIGETGTSKEKAT